MAVWAPLPFSHSVTLLQLLPTALAIFLKLVIHLPAFISSSDIRSQACGHTFALVFTSSPCTAYTYSALLSPSLQSIHLCLLQSLLFLCPFITIPLRHKLLTFCTNKFCWLKKEKSLRNQQQCFLVQVNPVHFICPCLFSLVPWVMSWTACRRKAIVWRTQCIYQHGFPRSWYGSFLMLP